MLVKQPHHLGFILPQTVTECGYGRRCFLCCNREQSVFEINSNYQLNKTTQERIGYTVPAHDGTYFTARGIASSSTSIYTAGKHSGSI